MRWHTAVRGTCSAVTLGGLSLDASRDVSTAGVFRRGVLKRGNPTRAVFKRAVAT